MTLESNLKQMERAREAYWRRYPGTSPVRLRWRALAVRHSFHVLPGERILELGAGTGLWAEHLTSVLRAKNPITAAVFDESFLQTAKNLPNVEYIHIKDLRNDLPAEGFDYIVGTAILCHELFSQNLQALHRLLKPGGQILFFEANYWNPQVFLKSVIRPLGRWAGHAECQIGVRKYVLMKVASQQGFVDIDIIPYDIVHPRTPRFLLRALKSLAFILEHAPGIKELCGTLYIWARKPGDEEARRPRATLAEHEFLFGSTSFVIPCHNEEMNVGPLTDAILRFYGPYVHEIIIVNDSSRDRTAEVTREIAQREPRIKLLDRKPPNGVGRALRDGYAAATGRYVLTMDCDFVTILPEFRDLFDAVAGGHDGAIGSRFSQESLLINYPFMKIVCNRGFHLIANILLPVRMRDISNNLKLYRSEIFKSLEIEQSGFAANAETGLKPLLTGCDICEVPISWINRTVDMGVSSFRIGKVAPGYMGALAKVVFDAWRGRQRLARAGGSNS
jgi:SAM-dependent methyltransferase